MKTIETLQSVLTPDAGHSNTIMIDDSAMELPWHDKSVAVSFQEIPQAGIAVSYRDGSRVFIPYSNVRYIITTAEIKDNKNGPHKSIPPSFKMK